jgi:hypothetical protein
VKAKVQIVSDSAELYQRAATELIRAARETVNQKGSFTIALAGGSTPYGLYSRLAADAELRAQFPWGSTHFFLGRRTPRSSLSPREQLSHAFAGNVMICVHKELELESVEQRFPARHYVVVDDKTADFDGDQETMGEQGRHSFCSAGPLCPRPSCIGGIPRS